MANSGKSKKTVEAGYGSMIQKSDRVNEGTSPSFTLMTAWDVEMQNEMMRRDETSRSAYLLTTLSYYVTLSSLIVLSSAYRETLLGLGGRTDEVVVLPLNLINFLVLSDPSKAGMPRSGPQLSQVFHPTRRKHETSKESGKKNRQDRKLGSSAASGTGSRHPCRKGWISLFTKWNFSPSRIHISVPFPRMRKANCLCFKATAVLPNPLYK